MLNLKTREFRNNITNYINSSDIPVEVKYLAIKDICNQLGSEANKAVVQEASELERLKQAQEVEKEESEAREDGN